MAKFKINANTQFIIEAGDYGEALTILEKKLDSIGAEEYRETYSDESFVSDIVEYYTIEAECGDVIEEFDTLKEAEERFNKTKRVLMEDYDELYICGFKQYRNYADDCLDEDVIYSRRYK